MICEFHEGPLDGMSVEIDNPPLLIVFYNTIGEGVGGIESFDKMRLMKYAYEAGDFGEVASTGEERCPIETHIAFYFIFEDREIKKAVDQLTKAFGSPVGEHD